MQRQIIAVVWIPIATGIQQSGSIVFWNSYSGLAHLTGPVSMEEDSDRFLYVLLADDDADDRLLFEDAVNELLLKVDLRTVKDGAELMNYLHGSGIILPQLLFLDLNMPFKNGFQCLEEIRSIPAFNDICIIIYSTTARPTDIDAGYDKGANLFLQKPSSFTVLKEVLLKIYTTDIFKVCDDKEQFVIKTK